MKKRDKNYAEQLAQDEIGIWPRRLEKYRTVLIYDGGEQIGFVSFGFRPDNTVYIYILAFEKHAQRQGFAAEVIRAVQDYGKKRGNRFRGLTARIHKTNEPALRAAQKHGYIIVGERAAYYDLHMPVAP